MAKTIITKTGLGSKVYDDKGNAIKGITEININSSVMEETKINVTFLSHSNDIEVDGDLRYYIMHPLTGKIKEIKEITFIDDEKWTSI